LTVTNNSTATPSCVVPYEKHLLFVAYFKVFNLVVKLLLSLLENLVRVAGDGTLGMVELL
jgi:hypothetical protein